MRELHDNLVSKLCLAVPETYGVGLKQTWLLTPQTTSFGGIRPQIYEMTDLGNTRVVEKNLRFNLTRQFYNKKF